MTARKLIALVVCAWFFASCVRRPDTATDSGSLEDQFRAHVASRIIKMEMDGADCYVYASAISCVPRCK